MEGEEIFLTVAAAKVKGSYLEERADSMFKRSHEKRGAEEGIWNPERTQTPILKNTPEWRGN